jgi:hypothetical protein
MYIQQVFVLLFLPRTIDKRILSNILYENKNTHGTMSNTRMGMYQQHDTLAPVTLVKHQVRPSVCNSAESLQRTPCRRL